MRKSAFIIIGLLSLTFFSRINTNSAQDFARRALRQCWNTENENLSNFTIASDNISTFLLPLSDGSVRALDKRNGEIIWSSDIGGDLASPILASGNKLYLTSQKTNSATAAAAAEDASMRDQTTELTVTALSLSTGVTSWQKTLARSNPEKIHLLASTREIIVVAENGGVYVLDKENGSLLSQRALGQKVTTTPFLLDGRVLVGTSQLKVLIIPLDKGKAPEEIALKNIPAAISAPDQKNLYVGDGVGNVWAIDRTDKKARWKTWTGAEVTSVIKVPQGLLVSSLDNYIYLLSEKNGKRMWKRRLSGRTIGPPLVREDVAVLSTAGGTDAVFVELKKGKLVNQVSVRGENYFTQNPAGIDDLVVFPTLKGLLAFGTEEVCQNKK